MPRPSEHTLHLPFTPPYDWETVLAFFRAHQLPFLETVDEASYERVVRMRSGLGWFRVQLNAAYHSVLLSVWNGSNQDVDEIAKSVRSMFDLDAQPALLLDAMRADKFLSGFWARHPGLRLARSWSATEAMFTAVLGQLVSVGFGRVLTSELMQAAGTAVLHPRTSQAIFLFPSAKQIIQADLSSVRTSEARRAAIRSLAEAVDTGAFDLLHGEALRKQLRNIRGVGAWTAEYVALRGFRDNDAFPATDYGLKQEAKRHPRLNVNSVRPWRGYAAIALWKSFAESKERA